MPDDYKSIGESLGYPICGYCHKVVCSSMGQVRGVAYHILIDENGKHCEPKDSCMGKQKALAELKAKYPKQDII